MKTLIALLAVTFAPLAAAPLAGAQPCPAWEVAVNGQCVPPPPCPAGQVMINNVCVKSAHHHHRH